MSTKEYGCFFCSGKSLCPNDSCPICGRPINISDDLVSIAINGYSIRSIIGRGFYGWTLLVEDNFQSFALKIIPKHRMKKAALADTEAKALAQCSPHRNIARFWRQLESTVNVQDINVDVLGLVFEFIDNARPLSRIVVDDTLTLSRSDVADILAGIASGLARMHSRGLWHDDLHDDNVLVRTVNQDENLSERLEAKIVDFGSATPRRQDQPEHGDHGDYEYLAKHIYQITLRFEIGNVGRLVAPDRTFTARLRRLAQRVNDRNVSRRNLAPADVVEEIRAAQRECTTGHNFPSFEEMRRQSRVSLDEPLANTNALNLTPQDVALLFRDSLGWMARLKKSEPIIVVGPRGCGKTMLLRYLSIESQARPRQNEITPEEVSDRLQKSEYAGFLISVGEIRTPFIRSAYRKLEKADQNLAEDYCREYINSQFAFEVCRAIAWLDSENLVPMTKEQTIPLSSVVCELLPDIGIGGQKNLDLQVIVEALDRHIMTLSRIPDQSSYRPSGLSRDDVLHRLATGLKSLNWLKSKEVFFLLDDYSVTMLSQFVQRAYNPVLFRLSDDVRIKISSEGDGPIREDSLHRIYREGRELTLVNLGEVYFQSNEKDGRIFFEEILKARYGETKKGSLSELKRLLGSHPSERSFAEYILSQKRLGDSRFYGFGLLCCLCSGDVSFILELLHALTQGHSGMRSYPIKPRIQDSIIKRFAHRQLADLKSTSEYGHRLYEFAERLGNLLKQYLVDSRGKERPDERLRIEIEGTGELCSEAQEMHDVLLRYSVLIPGGAGKSQKGLPTRRLFFRRLFAPCFPFSPSRNGCVPLTVHQYESWLLDPKKIWTKPPGGPAIKGTK